MRVIVIAYNCNPQRGSEASIAAEWVKIIARSHEVDVYTDAAHRNSLQVAEMDDVSIHYVDGLKIWRRVEVKLGIRGLAPRYFQKKVLKLLQKRDLSSFSVIHTLTPAAIHQYNNCHRLGLPVIIGPLGGGLKTPAGFEKAFAGSRLETALRDRVYPLLRKRPAWLEYIRRADRIIVGTESVRSLLPETARLRCHVVFDTVVDTSVFKPPRYEKGCSAGKLKLIFVANLVGKKGPWLLVEAIVRLVEQGFTNFHLEILGAGTLRGELQRYTDRHGVADFVTFRGRLAREDVVRHLQQSDIFILPTLREPGGTAILEAMACGLPVITSGYGGPKDIVTSDCGVLVELLDYDDYVVQIQKAILSMAADESLRKQMGYNARQRVIEHYSAHALSGKIEEIYEAYQS